MSEQLRSYAEEREYAIGYYQGKLEKAWRVVIRLIRLRNFNMKAERKDSTLTICEGRMGILVPLFVHHPPP